MNWTVVITTSIICLTLFMMSLITPYDDNDNKNNGGK